MSLRLVLPLSLALALWFGSLLAWGVAMTASQDWGALGPDPSNAEIYPIENRQLFGFSVGLLSSFATVLLGFWSGRLSARRT